MRPKNTINIVLVSISLLMVHTSAFGQGSLPGALIHLDASTQNIRDKAWKNLGLAGGQLPPNDSTPDIKDGTIRIPEAGFTRKLKWYTVSARGEGFAGKPDLTPAIKLKDWTVEFLVKRNGPKWPDLVVATQVIGFHSRERGRQGLRILMNGPDTGEVVVWIKGANTAKGKWFAAAQNGIDMEKKSWHWVSLVYHDRQKLEIYQNGKKVAALPPTQRFHGDEEMWPTIFSAWESDRTFNGAFAIIRIYDRAFSHREINQNITGDLSVNHRTKLATTWCQLKTMVLP